MPPRILLSLLTAALLALAVAAPASASSVAYIDDHNLWFSSPDGARKVQVTQGGNDDASWMFPAQGRDGKTVVVQATPWAPPTARCSTSTAPTASSSPST